MKCASLFVVIFVGFVVKCSPMSLSELEDFANFLKRTSQLDETLKKGTDPSDFDEDENISDHAWEDSGKFEGDLILNERQRRLIVEDVAEGLSRNGLKDSTKRWPDNEVIYYIQKEHFSSDQIEAIQNGIDDLTRAACIKFRPYRKGDRDAVVIQGSRRGCFSQVGYQGGYQVLNLAGRHPVGRGCFRHGTVVHELLHTLGFYHMQSSPDRDDFVDIVWENIVQPARHNFRKYNAFSVSDFGVGYDYDSVLHYSRRAFSSNGQDTIVPKQSGADIGQRVGLSDKDIMKLNKMYCDSDSSNDDNESTTQKSSSKKKPRNKPFEGHGIGYHQGKTVVIKLLPTAETYQIANKPVNYMFDYFSKAPQILPSKEVQEFGVGRQVAYTYKPNENEYFFNKAETDTRDEIHKVPETNLNNRIPEELEELKKNITKERSQKENSKISADDLDDDLREAFQHLSKLLKSNINTSQTPDLNAYKTNTDYSDYADPKNIPKIALKYIPVPDSKEKQNDKDSIEYIESLHNGSPDSLYSEKKRINYEKILVTPETNETPPPISEEQEDRLYGTAYPFKSNPYVSNGLLEIKTPEYAQYEHLKDKDNYDTLHEPYMSNNNETAGNKQYKLLGEYVPIYGDWYNKEENKQNSVNYNRESFVEDNNEKSKYRVNDKSGSSEYEPESNNEYYTGSYSPQKKEAYTLFGVPVPLTQNWYRVDHTKNLKKYPYDNSNINNESEEVM